jgi:hypothetical protein
MKAKEGLIKVLDGIEKGAKWIEVFSRQVDHLMRMNDTLAAALGTARDLSEHHKHERAAWLVERARLLADVASLNGHVARLEDSAERPIEGVLTANEIVELRGILPSLAKMGFPIVADAMGRLIDDYGTRTIPRHAIPSRTFRGERLIAPDLSTLSPPDCDP